MGGWGWKMDIFIEGVKDFYSLTTKILCLFSCYAFRGHWTNDFQSTFFQQQQKMATHKDEQVTVRFFYSEHASDQDPLDPVPLILDSWIRIQEAKSKEENVRILLC